MGWKDFFRFGKKGAKAAQGMKGKGGKGGDSGSPWPDGIRVGVFGHSNVGKTVYFTVLNEESKIAKELQISVTDSRTSGEFLKNFRQIWGLGVSDSVGTMVDKRGEKRFPDPSQSEHVLQFNAQLDRAAKVSVVSHDYPGDAVSISSQTDIDDKVMDFLVGADGLLIFFDPKTLQAELQTQAHVAAFVHMLERLAPLNKRLPIPVSLVITKSDILPGFTGEERVMLVSPEQENLLAEDFDTFLEYTLASNRIAADSAWAGSVRNVLVKLREFLKVVVGRTLDFQVFFISSVGSEPEKIGTDVGRSIYKPPDRISPIGVKQPFYWLLKAILRNRKISRLRKVSKWVATLSILWCVIFSIPFLWHFMYLLPQATNTERDILESYNGNMLNTTREERGKINREYGEYERAFFVKHLFPRFVVPSGRIRAQYGDFDLSEAVKRLDQVINRFTQVVEDSALWPKLNPTDKAIITTAEHDRILNDLNDFRRGDSTSTLFVRADRVLTYWELFTQFISNRGDTAAYNALGRQVEFDSRTYAQELSSAEKELGTALTSNLSVVTEKKVQREVAQKAGAELGDMFDKINRSESIRYRFSEGPAELKKIRRQLDPEADRDNIRAIDRYLDAIDKFKQRREYKYKILSIPGGGHLHVDVTGPGEEPTWQGWLEQGDLVANWDYSLTWKMGDQIHIAFDTLGHQPEDGGRTASDKKTLSGDYALFNMEGEVVFDNLGKTVTIQFSPALRDRLPTIEQ